MEYYSIIRTDNLFRVQNALRLDNGYKFGHKVDITLYNPSITKSILLKKIDTSLKKIIESLMDDEDGSGSELPFKIESLKKLIVETYLPYIGRKNVEKYLLKIKEVEKKLHKKKTRTK